jgi:hypothetical protein
MEISEKNSSMIKNFFYYKTIDSKAGKEIEKLALMRILFVGALIAFFLLGTVITGTFVAVGIFGFWDCFIWTFLGVSEFSNALKALLVVLSVFASGILIGFADLLAFFLFFRCVVSRDKEAGVELDNELIDEKNHDNALSDVELGKMEQNENEDKRKALWDKLSRERYLESTEKFDEINVNKKTLLVPDFPANVIEFNEDFSKKRNCIEKMFGCNPPKPLTNFKIVASSDPAYNKKIFWNAASLNLYEVFVIFDLNNKYEDENSKYFPEDSQTHSLEYQNNKITLNRNKHEKKGVFLENEILMGFKGIAKTVYRYQYLQQMENLEGKNLKYIVAKIENIINNKLINRVIVHNDKEIGTGMVIIGLAIKNYVDKGVIKEGKDLEENIVKTIFAYAKKRFGKDLNSHKDEFLKENNFKILLNFTNLCIEEK